MRKGQSARDELLRRLRAGVYPVGSLMPPERHLAAELGVSRQTLRSALALVASLGMIRREQGHGTTVTARAATGRAPTKVLLRYMESGPTESEHPLESVAGRFMELHPEIEVECAAMRRVRCAILPDYPEVSGADHPTIAFFSYQADFAHRGDLLALDEMEDIVDVTSQLNGGLVYRTWSHAGRRRLHAVPVATGTWMLLANQALLERYGLRVPESPMTWAELESLCAEVRARGAGDGVQPVDLDLSADGQTVTRLLPYLLHALGDASPGFSQPGAEIDEQMIAQFVRMLCRLCGREGANSGSVAAARPEGLRFREGTAAFRLSAQAEAAVAATRRLGEGRVRALPVPVPSNGRSSITIVHGGFAGVLARTVQSPKEVSAAWAVLKYLVSREGQRCLCGRSATMPARPDMEQVIHDGSPMAAAFLDYGRRCGRRMFDVPQNEAFHRAMRLSMARAVSGACSPESAAAEVRSVLESLSGAVSPSDPMEVEESSLVA